jgi:hypothetical protein
MINSQELTGEEKLEQDVIRHQMFHASILFFFCLPSTHNTIELMRTDHNNHSLNDQMAKIGKRGELVDFSYFNFLSLSSHHYQSVFFSFHLIPHGHY